MRIAIASLALWLAACGGGTSGSPDGAATPIVAWGDSLTAGKEPSYPADLAEILGRRVVNRGVGAQTSAQIAARQGGAPALLSLVGGLLPPEGLAIVSEASTSPVSAEAPTLAGTLAGIHGLLTVQAAPTAPLLLFQRDDAGLPEIVPAHSPFAPDTAEMRGWVNLLWLGRNNYDDPDQVLRDLRACVAWLTTDRYLVLGVPNAANEPRGTPAYEQIGLLNARIAQAFGDHYLDVRRALVDAYDPADPQDMADHAADVPPSSLRDNALHLNAAGRMLVAQVVADRLRMRGW